MPEIVGAAARAFSNIDHMTVLNGAQGITEMLKQMIAQAGPTLDLAKQALRPGNGNGAGKEA